MPEIKVSQINVYPIKSCSPIEGDSAAVDRLGLEHDRAFMLIGNRGQMITQRTHPQLALVRTAISEMGNVVNVTAPGYETQPVSTELDMDAEEIDIDLFKKTGTGVVDADGSAYFSEYLGKDARLVRIKQPRTTKPECHVDGAVTQTGFADGFPILLTSEASLEELNGQLEDPISIDRFRANIVIEGSPAYDEDYWREIRIGALRAYVVRACARCPMPNVDQSVGKLPKERTVTAALREHRGGIDPVNESKGEFFGQNLAHVFKPGQKISVGDSVEVVDRSSERNVQIDS